MNVLGLVGSPRKASNTDLLVTAVLEGACRSGCDTQKVYLYDYDILPCVDCKACKKGHYQCALKDDMQTLYPKLEEADVIVFGTPLYWYGATGKMKLLLDRLRSFIASKKLKGKKTVLVIPSEEGADACELAVGMFRLSLKYLEADLVDVLLPKASERAEITSQQQVLAEAFGVGRSLRG